MFDTHTHLYDAMFENPQKTIEKCLEENNLLLMPGDNYSNSLKALELSESFKNVYCAVGLHPLEVKEDYQKEIEKIIDLCSKTKIKAIGEIGLDYYWIKDEHERKRQREAFILQIQKANSVKLPIIIHDRDAHEDTYQILKQYPPLYGGVLHCYSGSLEMMEKFLSLGLYIGLDGPVTFKNAKTPKEVAAKVPLNRLLVETDSPYLSPEPKRGQRNDSLNLKYIIKAIADIRGLNEQELADITEQNGRRFFGIE